MNTLKHAIFVNGWLLPIHVPKKAVIRKSTDDHQLTIKGTPPSLPLTICKLCLMLFGIAV
ncbi:hypothetical protein P3X46_033930, partial [Hevea brasiliensis]